MTPVDSQDEDSPRRLAAIQQFFRQLWPDGLPEDNDLVLVDGSFTGHRSFRDLFTVAAAILAGLFFCFGCAAMSSSRTGRGLASDATAIPGLWLDLDIRDGNHKKTALPSLKEALELLRALPMRPTLVVHSGGGLHVWWLFREPWTFDSATERNRAQRLITSWQAYILELASSKGWKLDETSSLARLLRPAGALNPKYEPQREVYALSDSGPRWNPSDLEDWFSWSLDGEREHAAQRAEVELPKELAQSIRRAIGALGLGTEEVRKDGRVHAVVLDTCPICGGEQSTRRGIVQGTAHVAPVGGALRCKRQSCDARDSGSGGGLSFADWVTQLLPSEEARLVLALRARERGVLFDPNLAPPLMPEDARTVSLEQADEGALLQHIQYCADLSLDRRQIVHCITPTASGKTRAVIEVLASQPSAYFAESHKMLDEVARELEQRNVAFVHIEGVGSACLFKSAIEFYGNRSDWRGTACMTCEHRSDGSCSAWKPIPEGAAILAPHESYPVLRDMRVLDMITGHRHSILHGRLVVIDEAYPCLEFTATSRDRLRVPLDHPEQFGEHADMAMAVTSMLDELLGHAARVRAADFAGDYPTRTFGENLRTLFQGLVASRNADALESSLAELIDHVGGENWPHPPGHALRGEIADPSEVPHPDLLQLWRAIPQLTGSDEAERAKAVLDHGLLEIVATDEAVWFELRRRNSIPLRRGAGVLLLDATGHLTRDELQAANPDTRIIDMPLGIHPDPRARVLSQTVLHSGVSRRSLIEEGQCTSRGVGVIRASLRAAAKLAQVHTGPGRHRAALLTYKPIADALTANSDLLEQVLPDGLDLQPDMIGYYGLDDRGSNRFRGVSVLVTLGDPIPNIGAVGSDARALGLEAEQLLRTRTLSTLVQAHGRARALRATGPVLLVHFGMADVPGWTDTDLAVPARGRPSDPVRDGLKLLVEQCLERGQIVSAYLYWNWLEAEPTAAINTYRESLVGIIGGRQRPPRRSFDRWIGEAAERHGAQKFSVRRGRRRMTAWRGPGLDEAAASESALELWRALGEVSEEPTEPASEEVELSPILGPVDLSGPWACLTCLGGRFWRPDQRHDWACASCTPPLGADLVEWRVA